MELQRWKPIKLYLTGVALIICMGAVLLHEPETKSGIIQGIDLCIQTLVPSLFPFLFLSIFLVRSGTCSTAGKFSSRLTEIFFRLPGCCAGVILMGMLGGYPVGISMTEELMMHGELTRSQARRIALFCVNAGPAFAISAVGTAMAGSTHTGIILYLSGAAALLITGILTRYLSDREEGVKKPRNAQPLPLTDAMTTSVASAVKAMVNICAWVLLFCAAGNLIRLIPMPEQLRSGVTYILEISSGCAQAARHVSPPVLSAMLSFSGLCVICQLMPEARRCGVPAWQLLFSRILSAGISWAVCALLCQLFPDYVQTFAGFEPLYQAGTSVSIPACAALLFMGLTLIYEVDIKHKT